MVVDSMMSYVCCTEQRIPLQSNNELSSVELTVLA
jgi:hypothetical protein